jgi:aspartate/methionine/tyrosine aminotransferase
MGCRVANKKEYVANKFCEQLGIKCMQNDKKKIIENQHLPQSIRNVVKIYPVSQVNRLYYGGLPHIGNALWDCWSLDKIQKAANAYEDYSLSTNLLIKGFAPPTESKIRLGGGSPAPFRPFMQCLNNVSSVLRQKQLFYYPLAAGDDNFKSSIIEYFKTNYSRKINENNIIFTHGSTQAFTLIMESILDFGDVVIMTSPNYGLFTFVPERAGGKVRFLELSANDGWKINSKKLKRLIDQINTELRIDYDRNRGKYVFRRSDTTPKVCAFVNYNPHNPTGVIYGNSDKSLLFEVSRVCKNAGVFIIDDLAYSGLEYDRKNLALPICSMGDNFDNTITLYTLSKSYGLAGFRSGLIVANEIICSFIRDRIFQVADSLSILQQAAISSIFNVNRKSQNERNKYLSKITKEYYNRLILVKTILLGKDKNNEQENNILNKILQTGGLNIKHIEDLGGIPDVQMVIEPASGFFILLDLTKFLGKSYRGFKIKNDKTLLQFLYTFGNIKVLTGNAFCWPQNEQLIIRATIAQPYKELIAGFLRLKRVLGLLR